MRWRGSTLLWCSQHDAAFPPILGTGGNDGRLDYSSNFHQRLIDVLPELGANPKMSRGWADDLLSGSGMTKLQSAAIGQFDGVGAGGPGSSIFGSADSRVNPWAFVLMLEGVTWFASSAARRLGETDSRAAMPFQSSPVRTARFGAAGVLVVSCGPRVRCRHRATSPDHAWARAVWQGTSAACADVRRSAHLRRRGSIIPAFGLLQRNGLAFVAILLDTVEVSTVRRSVCGRAHSPGAGLRQGAWRSDETAYQDV